MRREGRGSQRDRAQKILCGLAKKCGVREGLADLRAIRRLIDGAVGLQDRRPRAQAREAAVGLAIGGGGRGAACEQLAVDFEIHRRDVVVRIEADGAGEMRARFRECSSALQLDAPRVERLRVTGGDEFARARTRCDTGFEAGQRGLRDFPKFLVVGDFRRGERQAPRGFVRLRQNLIPSRNPRCGGREIGARLNLRIRRQAAREAGGTRLERFKKLRALNGVEVKQRIGSRQSREELDLQSLRQGIGGQLAAKPIGPQVRRAAVEHLVIQRDAERAFVHEEILAGQRGFRRGHEHEPRGVVREDDCFFRGHRGGYVVGELPQRVPVLELHRGQVAQEERRRNPERRSEHQRDDSEVSEFENSLGPFPCVRGFLAKNQQQIAAEVADAQRAQIIKRQERQAVTERTRTEHRVERNRRARHEKHRVHHVKHHGGKAVAQRVGVAERGCPADAHDEHGQDRGEREQQRAALRILEEQIFLRAQFHSQQGPKARGRVRSNARREREHQIQRESRRGPRAQAQQQRRAKQRHAFDPEERDGEEREKADHRPVVGHRHRVQKREGVEPTVVARGAVFEQTQHDGGEQQQVENLAGRGGGVFPKRLLEAAREHAENHRCPRPPHRQQRARMFVQPALFLGAIVREQRDRARENAERRGRADGGEKI